MANVNKSYYKEKIIEKLNLIRDDIGEARYLLYSDTVDDCDDIEMLKQMYEIDMQIGYIRYVREQISDKINKLGYTISDIEEIMNGFGEEQTEIESVELSTDEHLMNIAEDDEERDLALLQEMARRYTETLGCDGNRIDGCRIGQEINIELEEEQYQENMAIALEEACDEIDEYSDEEDDDGEEYTEAEDDEEVIEEDDYSNNETDEYSDEEIYDNEDEEDGQEYDGDGQEDIEYEADEEIIETDEGDIESLYDYEFEEDAEAYYDVESLDIENEADGYDDIEEETIEGSDDEQNYDDVEEEVVESDINEMDFEDEETVYDDYEDGEADFNDVEEDFIECGDDEDYNLDNIEEESVDVGYEDLEEETLDEQIGGTDDREYSSVKRYATEKKTDENKKQADIFKDKKANKIFSLMSKLV